MNGKQAEKLSLTRKVHNLKQKKILNKLPGLQLHKSFMTLLELFLKTAKKSCIQHKTKYRSPVASMPPSICSRDTGHCL